MSRLLQSFFESTWGNTAVPFEVIFADGARYRNKGTLPEVIICFKSRLAQLNTIINHGWGLIESYIHQSVDIKGDLKLLIRASAETGPSLIENTLQLRLPHPLIRLRNFWHEFRFGNRNLPQAVKNALFHYNRGSEIFWQYLDPTMTYTCAYWKNGTRTLKEAQENKPLFGYNRGRPVSIHDADYLNERPGSIKEKLLRFLAADGLEASVSSVILITSARYLNYIFNPVSFYYCLDAGAVAVRMVAEVNNTFGERHVYLPKQKQDQNKGTAVSPYFTTKAFHVSPFNDMAGEYEFIFSPLHSDLDIHTRLLRGGSEVFHARLFGKPMPLTTANLTKLILRHPFVPHLIKPRIFMEAARLYFQKHMKYHPKPNPVSPMTIKKERPAP